MDKVQHPGWTEVWDKPPAPAIASLLLSVCANFLETVFSEFFSLLSYNSCPVSTVTIYI